MRPIHIKCHGFDAMRIAINKRDTIARGRIIKCAKWRAAQEELAMMIRAERHPIIAEPVELGIVFTCARRSKCGLGFGDVDAPVKAIMDALVHGGVLTDDVIVGSVTSRKVLEDGSGPWLSIYLREFFDVDEVPF